MVIQPAKGINAKLLRVFVSSRRDIESKLLLGVMKCVDSMSCLKGTNDSIQWENAVAICVADEKRTGGDHRGQLWVIPLEGVDEEHAITVSFHTIINNVILQVGDAGNGDCCSNAFIQGCNPPTVDSTATTPGNTDSIRVNFVSRFEVVNGANAIPRFDSGWRVAAAEPPPHVVAVSPMVDAFNFTELQ